MHQRATLVEFSQINGCESELFGQIRHGSGRVLIVARQKDDPVAAFDDRIGSQDGCNQVIETFHELSAGERLRDEGGGQEAVQLFRENSERVRRVDDSLAFPARQGLRNLAMFPERDRQDDCVGLQCIPQRLGDDRGPIARASGVNASGDRGLATVTLMFLRAKACARAWPIFPNPTIA